MLHLEYFGKESLVKTANEAVEFINSLTLRNQGRMKISCSEHTRELLEDLFQGEWKENKFGAYYIRVKKQDAITFSCKDYFSGFQLRTTGCSNTSIFCHRPLGDTLEAHKAEGKRIADERMAEKVARAERERNARMDALYQQREGWYSVSLVYERMRMDNMRTVETTFTGKCIAKSGIDAYDKALDSIRKDGEASFGATFPSPESESCYSFLFLGTKTDGGYTYE